VYQLHHLYARFAFTKSSSSGRRTARFKRNFNPESTHWRARRWIIGPGLLYRWRNERVYGFAGGAQP
jgi:hypothetical protein